MFLDLKFGDVSENIQVYNCLMIDMSTINIYYTFNVHDNCTDLVFWPICLLTSIIYFCPVFKLYGKEKHVSVTVVIVVVNFVFYSEIVRQIVALNKCPFTKKLHVLSNFSYYFIKHGTLKRKSTCNIFLNADLKYFYSSI